MIPHFTILPILLPLLSAVVLMFFWSKPRNQRVLSVIGHGLTLMASYYLAQKTFTGEIFSVQAGNWSAPFGITFVADALSGMLVLLASLAAFAVSIFSAASIGNGRASFGYFPILQFLLMGLNGSFLAGDIFNLYVWFEVIIISSFVLITLGGEKAQLEGAVKYVTLNLLASVIFLTGIAVLYGIMGSLNLADLAVKISASPDKGLINTAAILFLVGFGIKSAIFPMYFWLPASYHTPPAAVSAIFGGLLTKVGVYALIRVFSLLFIEDPFIRDVFIVLAVLSMITGAVGAIGQQNIRKVFSYLIISHIGFMIAGLGMYSTLALMGAVFYLFHDILVKTNVFLISGVIFKMRGSFRLENLGGLYNKFPLISIVFAIVMFSLVGTPPLSGFWPKLYLLQSSFTEGELWIFGAILLASFLTLIAIVKVWLAAFWKKPVENKIAMERIVWHQLIPIEKFLILLPILILTTATLYIGFYAENISDICKLIAEQIQDKSGYIEAVMPQIETNINPENIP
ncbi:MAG: Na+/H+ antiporter subunit D [Cryomorphaceae bacterium]|nr:Na+/H+ antiporter subunit D [Cryomorphaceae bacterium]